MSVNTMLTTVIGVEIIRWLRLAFRFEVRQFEMCLGPITKLVNTGRNNIAGYLNIKSMKVFFHPVAIKIFIIASSTLGTMHNGTNMDAPKLKPKKKIDNYLI